MRNRKVSNKYINIIFKHNFIKKIPNFNKYITYNILCQTNFLKPKNGGKHNYVRRRTLRTELERGNNIQTTYALRIYKQHDLKRIHTSQNREKKIKKIKYKKNNKNLEEERMPPMTYGFGGWGGC